MCQRQPVPPAPPTPADPEERQQFSIISRTQGKDGRARGHNAARTLLTR